MKESLSVIKIGGHVIDDRASLLAFLEGFVNVPGKKILVHGGGKRAGEIANQLGIESQMVDGRRITSSEMLDVATMVYGGYFSKNISSLLVARGVNALGLSGADAGLIQSTKRNPNPIDFGFVGDIQKVDANKLHQLLTVGFTPLFCALTADDTGQLLNTNADAVAADIAMAMTQHYDVNLTFAFEKKGVLDHVDLEDSVIPNITEPLFEELKALGKIHSGMLPKLTSAFRALHHGVQSVNITKFVNPTPNSGTILKL